MDGNNITHMKLFYQLKQKFPDVKDDDVNESIQKFGLNREQCEVDLQQKCLVHHGGYYGPWGRHTANNSEASSAVTSPQRELGTLSPSLITSENSPVTTIHNTTAFHYIDAPGNMGTVNDRTITPRAMFTHCGGDWHPAITCQNEIMSPSKDINQLQLYIDQKHIQRTADVPATAPIISASNKPFNPFPNEPTHTRRWSQESGCDVSKELLHQQFDNLAIRHSICTEQDVKDLEKTTTSPKDRPGMRHVSTVYITPTLPHEGHEAPTPPTTTETPVSCGSRSYTSVNLQLRQPSSDPQPAINVGGSGSSLTYSTSSLDPRGSRSSLQISIGPGGGTISAVRTHNQNKSIPNTAFHIQYSSPQNGDESDSSTILVTSPVGESEGGTPPSGICHVYGPFVGIEGNVPVPVSVPSSTVLPGGTAAFPMLHYPPSSVEEEVQMLGFPSSAAWVPDPSQAIVHEQLQHKEKLEEEIAASTNEKMKLASDLTKLERDIILKEQQRKEAANINRKKIEEIQEHNQKLQYACDQMEAEIIQFGERDSPLSTISSESNTPVSAAPMPSFISSRVPSTTQPTSLPANHQSIYGRPSNENSVPETSSNHADRPNTSTNSQACWNCSKCTYDNITDLHVCEMCGFPRYNLGTDHSNTRASPQDKNGGSVPCYCRRHRHYCRESTGELQDIHIHVRHEPMDRSRYS